MRNDSFSKLSKKLINGFKTRKDHFVSVGAMGNGYIYQINCKDVGKFFITFKAESPQRVEDIAAKLRGGFGSYAFMGGVSKTILDEKITTSLGTFEIIGIPESELVRSDAL